MSDTPAALPPMKLPEVPAAKPLATQLEEAMAKLPEPKPAGMRRIKKEKSKEPEVKAEEPKEEPKPAEPEPPKPEPVTQEKLSHGFAKLVRQQKAAEREDARIKAELAKLDEAKSEHEKSMSSLRAELDKRQKDIDELMKLFDEDADKFVDAIARKKNQKKEDVYDRWTRQRLNGGVPAAEDQIARTNSEAERVRKEFEEYKAAQEAKEKEKSETEAKAKKEAEERQKLEELIQAQNTGLIQHVRDPGKYPLLSKENDEDIIRIAWQVVGNSSATYEQVAGYLERQLSFQKWQEEQAGKPAEAETPTSAPKPEGKKAESSKTLTNKLASTQTAPSTRRNDERIEDVISRVWPDR